MMIPIGQVSPNKSILGIRSLDECGNSTLIRARHTHLLQNGLRDVSFDFHSGAHGQLGAESRVGKHYQARAYVRVRLRRRYQNIYEDEQKVFKRPFGTHKWLKIDVKRLSPSLGRGYFMSKYFSNNSKYETAAFSEK